MTDHTPVDDPAGDDVAPDAFGTTGGKNLDSIIDDHRGSK